MAGGDDTTEKRRRHAAAIRHRSNQPNAARRPSQWPRRALPNVPKRLRDNGWIMKVGAPAGTLTGPSKPPTGNEVNLQMAPPAVETVAGRRRRSPRSRAAAGTTALPLLGDAADRPPARVSQDPGRMRRPLHLLHHPAAPAEPVEQAGRRRGRGGQRGSSRPVTSRLVLTGIFLGAYGQPTALRRRRPAGRRLDTARGSLVDALCTRVPGLRRSASPASSPAT